MLPQFISHSPWYFYLLSASLAFVIAYLLYLKNKKDDGISKTIVIWLSILRFCSSFIILFLLLELFIKHNKNQTEPPIIIIANDNSASVGAYFNNPDSASVWLKVIQKFKQDLGAKYTIKTLSFGSKTKNQIAALDYGDKETDLENLLREISNNYSNQNIGALILSSDGIYNKGANPIYLAEKLQFPIYPIALGDTNDYKDIQIQKINHNQIAYLGNQFPVEVHVLAKKYKNQTVKVSLIENGIELTSKTIDINSDQYSAVLNFSLSASRLGICKYLAKVESLAGEKNTLNNSQNFILEVINNREKILLLAASPHPDVAALKESILNNSIYELDFQMLSDFNKNIKAYSLVIFHGMAGGNNYIEECKKNLTPYWIIHPKSTDLLPGVRINGSYNKFNDAEAIVNNNFDLFTLSDAFKKFSPQLPALKTFFGNYLLNNSSQTLLFQKIGAIETDQPIVVFNEIGGTKSACFIGDGLWTWKMRDYAEHQNHQLFDELISKTIQYLAVKNDKSQFRIKHKKLVNENEEVEIEAEVYNKSYELITSPEVRLKLSNEKNEKFNYTFSKSNNNYRVNLGILSPGEYKYTASVKIGEQIFEKNGVIMVKELLAESLNTLADHQLLYQLASRTGASLYFPNQIQALTNALLDNPKIKTITYSQSRMLRLIDLQVFFWLILLFLGTEWMIRKRYLRI